MFQSFTPSGSDVIIFSIIKCSAVIYTYLQFRNIRRRGTKYMLGNIQDITSLDATCITFLFSPFNLFIKSINAYLSSTVFKYRTFTLMIQSRY